MGGPPPAKRSHPTSTLPLPALAASAVCCFFLFLRPPAGGAGAPTANSTAADDTCAGNPFLAPYTPSDLAALERRTRAFLSDMYGATAALYDSLVSCPDEGKGHPTACPVAEPAGPHAQYSLIKPTMDCRDQAYFGAQAGDGRKAVCSPERLAESCVIYSLGSNNDFSFEEDVLRRTPCEVHTFDCTIGRKPGQLKPRLHFHDWCIAGRPTGDGRYLTIPQIMAKLGHKNVDLMKMDIEGYEQGVFAGWQPADDLPGQLIVEVHGCNAPVRTKYRHLALGEVQLLVGKLLAVGYRLAVIDPQKGCSNCVEMTLVRAVCPK